MQPIRQLNRPVRSTSPRFTIPHRSASPSVLHVFPAHARADYMARQQQQQQRRSPSNQNQNQPRARSGSPRTQSPFNNNQQNQNPRSGRTSREPYGGALLRGAAGRAGTPTKRGDPRSMSAAASVAPFRDITRQPTSTTIDGRLLYLLKDFSSTVMPAQDHKVQNIASRLRRSKILSQPELNALETCFNRNANFMSTIERILAEAVEKQVDMRRSVIHQSYEVWRACADANGYIGMLLDTAQSAIGVGKFSRNNVKNYNGNPQQGGGGGRAASSSSMARTGSPGLSRSASNARGGGGGGGQRYGTPATFQQIARPAAPSRQQLAADAFSNQHYGGGGGGNARGVSPYTRQLSSVPRVSQSLGGAPDSHQQFQQFQQNQHDFSQNETMPPNQQNQQNQPPPFMQLGAGDAERMYRASQHRHPSSGSARGGAVGPVGVEDAREAQTMFEKLFGPEEGRTRFLHWLSELPPNTIQQLHRQLAVNDATGMVAA